MSGEAAFVHDLSLETYGFGEDYPLQPLRIRMTIELCEPLGLLEGYSLATPLLPGGSSPRLQRAFFARSPQAVPW